MYFGTILKVDRRMHFDDTLMTAPLPPRGEGGGHDDRLKITPLNKGVNKRCSVNARLVMSSKCFPLSIFRSSRFLHASSMFSFRILNKRGVSRPISKTKFTYKLLGFLLCNFTMCLLFSQLMVLYRECISYTLDSKFSLLHILPQCGSTGRLKGTQYFGESNSSSDIGFFKYEFVKYCHHVESLNIISKRKLVMNLSF